jgi:hypothetical protein
MTKRFYVNAYAVTRNYGGPEEGGWYYNAGEPLASVPIRAERLETCPEFAAGHCGCYFTKNLVITIEPPCRQCEEEGEHLCPPAEHWQFATSVASRIADLHDEFADVVDGDIHSVRGGVAVEVRVEESIAAHWPSKTPHYE